MKKILFVDDDRDDREFFVDALSYVDSSIECTLAKDCEEALEMLSKAQPLPNYIFLDIHMPKMGGKECLNAIRNNSRFQNVKVVMYSNFSDEELIGEYRSMGATFFLIKPSTFKGLCDSLAVMLA